MCVSEKPAGGAVGSPPVCVCLCEGEESFNESNRLRLICSEMQSNQYYGWIAIC